MKKIVVAVLVAFVVVIAIIGCWQYVNSPKPEIVSTQQTWASSWVSGGRPTNIDVVVKNNGKEGWITVYIEYQDIDKNNDLISKIKSREVYLLSDEIENVRFTLYNSEEEFPPRYNLPLLSHAWTT